MKRLYSYTLSEFIPTFIMTFSICLFIVLMQFLWRFVNDLVGKGIDILVLAELFVYAALTLVPMALPLGILLASLMTFGNLGEKLELLAIKASGISLLRTMTPLIVFISCISVGMFFFQNNIMPQIETKFRALFLSIKYKSPELDIPEGTFYSDIEGYNLYVKSKDEKNRTLHGVMIYSTSGGIDNMSVIIADSAKMRVSEYKDYLKLTLYHGQQYSNFKQSQSHTTSGQTATYARENFRVKHIVIPFDAGFNRIDESSMSDSQIAKDISKLQTDIDSMKHELDSLHAMDRGMILESFSVFRGHVKAHAQKTTAGPVLENDKHPLSDTISPERPPETLPFAAKDIHPISPDSVIAHLPWAEQQSLLEIALSQSDAVRYSNQTFFKTDTQRRIRYHQVELYRKFAISLACLAFFFIGAPLGAIIRKGGLGMPVVISVILFIVYYIISNIGNKMARDGVLDIWIGMFLSLFVLAPLGVFLTIKANNDSAIFNSEGYHEFFKMVLGRSEKRNIERKPIVIDAPDPIEMEQTILQLTDLTRTMKQKHRRQSYYRFWFHPDWRRGLDTFSMKLESLVADASKWQNSSVLYTISRFPSFTYLILPDFKNKILGALCGIIFIIGIPLYIWVSIRDKMVRKKLDTLILEMNQLLHQIKNNHITQ